MIDAYNIIVFILVRGCQYKVIEGNIHTMYFMTFKIFYYISGAALGGVSGVTETPFGIDLAI